MVGEHEPDLLGLSCPEALQDGERRCPVRTSNIGAIHGRDRTAKAPQRPRFLASVTDPPADRQRLLVVAERRPVEALRLMEVAKVLEGDPLAASVAELTTDRQILLVAAQRHPVAALP